jgi:hypothetical protein
LALGFNSARAFFNENLPKMNDWFSIADTAIKIGLGALISAIATYLTTRKTHAHELQKLLVSEKMTLLKEVTIKIESSSAALNRVHDIFSHKERSPDDVRAILSGITDAFNDAKEARALCYLLGDRRTGELLKLYLASINKLGSEVKTSQGAIALEEIRAITAERNSLKEQILEGLHGTLERTYGA